MFTALLNSQHTMEHILAVVREYDAAETIEVKLVVIKRILDAFVMGEELLMNHSVKTLFFNKVEEIIQDVQFSTLREEMKQAVIGRVLMEAYYQYESGSGAAPFNVSVNTYMESRGILPIRLLLGQVSDAEELDAYMVMRVDDPVLLDKIHSEAYYEKHDTYRGYVNKDFTDDMLLEYGRKRIY